MLRFILIALALCSCTLSWSNDLVVSTQPIYLISKAVTQGIEQPKLLLANQSGHDITLKPAHRKTIQDASLVIWLGKAHEAPLDKVLSSQPKAISILDSGLVKLLPLRNTRGKALPNTVDTHIWLDPNNAVRIGFFIAALRSQQYPAHRQAYWNNARAFAARMLKVTQQYNQTGQSRPYWSYHDAYQYLERPLNLRFAGALTDDPHIAPTMSQIRYLNQQRPSQKMCLLAEGHASQAQYRSLNPIIFQKVDESMSNEQDFIVAWKDLADQAHRCVVNAR